MTRQIAYERYLDKKLFAADCKMKRPEWGNSRVSNEWEKIKAGTPDHLKRHSGPSESPLQLPMPGWIFGDDERLHDTTNFHTKAVSIQSGPKPQ